MHIPDGYLGPQTYLTTYAAMGPLWFYAGRRVKKSLSKKLLPRLALAGAFSFVVMMFNLPVLGGSTGHAVGSALIAIIFGPWAALMAVSVALIIQALAFGDGGITALGANCLTMAVIMPFTASWIYRSVVGKTDVLGLRQKLAGFLAGYISINFAAVAAGFLLGIQPMLASANGRPQYAPYPLSVAVPAMAGGHLLFFGIVEGLVTALVLTYLARSRVLEWPRLTVAPLSPQRNER